MTNQFIYSESDVFENQADYERGVVRCEYGFPPKQSVSSEVSFETFSERYYEMALNGMNDEQRLALAGLSFEQYSGFLGMKY